MMIGRAPHPQGGVLLVEVGDDLRDAGHMDYPADHLRMPVVGEQLAGNRTPLRSQVLRAFEFHQRLIVARLKPFDNASIALNERPQRAQQDQAHNAD
jgi:hypothetical protein